MCTYVHFIFKCYAFDFQTQKNQAKKFKCVPEQITSKMRLGAGHAIILTAILVSVIGTFFAANAITGFTVAKEGVEKGTFPP